MATNITGFAQILAEDCDFIVCLICQEGDLVLVDGDNHSNLISELASANDLDVVTNVEAFAECSDRNVNLLPDKFTFGNSDRDDIGVNAHRLTDNTLLLTSVNLDDITWEVRSQRIAILETVGQRLKVEVLSSVLSSRSEPGDLFERGVHVSDCKFVDSDIPDLEAILEFFVVVCPSTSGRVSLEGSRVALSGFHLAKQSLRRLRDTSTAERSLALAIGSQRRVSHAIVQSRDESNASFQAVLSNIDDLSKITVVLRGSSKTDPGSGLQSRGLRNTEQLRHILEINQDHLGMGIDVHHTVQSL